MSMLLMEICDVFSGYAFKSFNDDKNGTPVIKIGNINADGTIDIENCQYTAENPNTKFWSRKGDLYIALSGATTGKIGLIQKDGYLINQRVGVVRIHNEQIPVDYLLYFLKSKTNKILHDAVGSAQPNISPKDISKYEFVVKSKEEMLRISSELNLIVDLIKQLQIKLKNYDDVIKSRFIELFGDVNTNSRDFKVYKIGTQFELGAGGTPKTNVPAYWENGTISWIGSNMCQDAVIYKNDGKFITEEGFRNSSTKILKPETVLVALVGATIGKTALLKFETTTNQNVLGIWNIVEAGYNPYFVFYYMQSIYHKFVELGDNSFKMASKAFVSELDILKPDIELQNDFADFVELIDKSKFVIQQQIKDLEELLDKKMDEYFGG